MLARLDARMAAPPYLLVAHNAATEAGFLFDYRQACPVLAAADLLDTIKLAKATQLDLVSYPLDSLLAYLQIPARPGRHRAMPDVELTAELFARLIVTGLRRSVGPSRQPAHRPARPTGARRGDLMGFRIWTKMIASAVAVIFVIASHGRTVTIVE